ncbi:MAG TPA: MerR family DNA-binding transcriptional regulator [Methylibium sp.]
MATNAVAHAANDKNASYSIGELAREFDLTTRAIRFYEDCGLLSPERRGPNGRIRVYSARDRTRLKLTLRGKRLGLSLAEVKELVDMYESPRDTQAQLKKFLVVLAEHRAQLEQQLADLQVTLDEVCAHEKDSRRLLAQIETPRKKLA